VDAVSVLTFYLLAQTAIPGRLEFSPLGGAGAPAEIISVACLAGWAYLEVQRPDPSAFGVQPIRWVTFSFLAAVLASYVVAMTRAIDGAEASTANLGLVGLLGWVGVLLVANDGIPDRRRFDVLVRRVVMAGALLSTLAMLQFFTGQPLIDRISFPGLSPNGSLAWVATRAGFSRPAATAIHPLEFAAAITMILPLAITLARTDRTRNVFFRWYPVWAMALGAVISISRSAIISGIVGLVVLAIAWPPISRWIAAVSITVFTFGVGLVIPGLVGSLVDLFGGIANDGSALSRSSSYSMAREFIDRAPIFGRGYSTFLPRYRILDNQFLGLMIEVGAVGLIAFIALLMTAVVCAERTRRLAVDETTKELAHAFSAAILAGACALAFFDGLSFPMCGGVLFLLLGLVGALRRLVRAEVVGDPTRLAGASSSIRVPPAVSVD